MRDADGVLAANSRRIDRSAADALRPPPPLNLNIWTETHRVFPEDSPQPGPYRSATAPYLAEILEACSPDSEAEDIEIIKCAQSGGSVVGESFIAGIGSEIGGTGMIIHPTVRAATDWVEEKFEPMAQVTQRLSTDGPGGVIDRTDRASGGSTRLRIRFRFKGWFVLAGANSAATLRQKSIRWMVQDDLDAWDLDADGEGDPERLAEQRLKTFRRTGTAKKVSISTPLIDGASRIQRRYKRSDQRRLYMRCLGCAAVVDWDWEDLQGRDENPADPYLVCPECGGVHHHPQRKAMLAGSVWIPTAPVPGQTDDEGNPLRPPKAIPAEEIERWRTRYMGPLTKRRGYWITGVINVFDTWAALCAKWLDAKGDPDAEKVFANTDLGHTFKVNTKTPDWEKLAARKSPDFHRGDGAWGALVFVLSVDVQRDGLYFVIKGYGRGEQTWTLDYGFLAGETAEPGKGAWAALAKIADEGAPLPGGSHFPFDGIVVDANFNTDAAKDFVKRHPAAIAINGAAGWGKPVIYQVTESELKASGKKRRFGGIKIWHVGTFTVKNILVTRYRNTIAGPDEASLPRGMHYWPGDTEDDYFKQITSEYVGERKARRTQQVVKEWIQRGANHYFDCDVYALAMLEQLKMRDGRRGHWGDDDWAERESALRDVIAADGGQPDLFAPVAKPREPETAPGLAPRLEDNPAMAALARMARRD